MTLATTTTEAAAATTTTPATTILITKATRLTMTKMIIMITINEQHEKLDLVKQSVNCIHPTDVLVQRQRYSKQNKEEEEKSKTNKLVSPNSFFLT